MAGLTSADVVFFDAFIFLVVAITALGLCYQCIGNQRAGHARFMTFPVALLILFPYPLWIILSWLGGDWRLFFISWVMGVPTGILSYQYFYYEWPRKRSIEFEDTLTMVLAGIGMTPLVGSLVSEPLESGLALSAAYYTCVISVFSYLNKVWRVMQGRDTLDGLKWSTMLVLLLFYCAMILVGWREQIYLLSVAYVFSVFACFLALVYKTRESLGRRAALAANSS